MRLQYRILGQVFATLSVILSIWAVSLYFVIMGEVFDEVDDNLEEYSYAIIDHFNRGEELPNKNNGTNNSYHIELVSENYIKVDENSIFLEEMIYIESKGETEPARIFKTIFRADNGKTYRLIVYTPSIEHKDLMGSILMLIISLFVLLLISITVINTHVYKISMSPMYKILQWLKDYRLGNTNSRLDNDTDITEFIKLNEAINKSIEKIEQNYITQKEFISNASHELQTPLAICKTRLDILLESDLKEQQIEQIIKTQHTIDYMTRLNKTLLLLSKIENQQFIDRERVDIGAIVEVIIADFKEIYESKQIDVLIESEGRLIVDINPILAKTLVINLIKNGYAHNIEHGTLYIKIEKTRLTVENSGEDTALDREYIFKRFYQGKKKKNSTGLGLAIVNTICKENNFDIKYSYVQDRHQFCVDFHG